MARKSKSVYERIEDKKVQIKEQEERLKQLNVELKELFSEKDDLEMRQLFEYARSNNITLEQIKSHFKDINNDKKTA